MKRKLIVISCLSVTLASHGQNLTNLKFSNPQLLNPALTGTSKDSELNFSSTNMFGRYNQTYLDYSQYSDKLHGGIGLYTNNNFLNFPNSSETMYSNALGFCYAYQNSINSKWHYSLGTSLEISNHSLNYSGINDNYLGLGVNIGGLLYTESFYTSLTFSHSNTFKTDTPWNDRTSIQVDFGYKIKPFKSLDFILTPSLSYAYVTGLESGYSYGRMNANLEAQYKKLHIGVGNNSGRLAANIGYDFKRFRLNYSMSNLASFGENPQSTTHQLSLKFKFNNKSKNSNRSSFNFNLF